MENIAIKEKANQKSLKPNQGVVKGIRYRLKNTMRIEKHFLYLVTKKSSMASFRVVLGCMWK